MRSAALDTFPAFCASPARFPKPLSQDYRRRCIAYRTHTCGALRAGDVGADVRLSGWVHRVRDHGGLLFIDLRDHYGLTQIVADPDSPAFTAAERVRSEWCIRVDGAVRLRPPETANPNLPTGEIEVFAREIEVLSEAPELPLPVFGEPDYPEDTRLKYRFLDLRRESLHRNIMRRVAIVAKMRELMRAAGFNEFQTPILTASSPEGARDFLVPSRLHPGKFYALPQAPQQFKQLIMMAGFDRYFQIAPCFRDEDPRADRLPGEFYQLDVEMSFVTQDDVFAAMEPVIRGVFEAFADGKAVTQEFPRIPYREAMRTYGTDKPDLRNPIGMQAVTEHFAGSGFKVFAGMIERDQNVEVWAIPAPGGGNRAFCDRMNSWAQGAGPAGPRLHLLPRGRGRGRRPDRQEHRPGADGRDPRAARPRRRRRGVLRRRQPGRFHELRRRGAHQDRRRSWGSSTRTASRSPGSSISRCSSGTRRRRRSTSPTTRSPCRRAGCEALETLDPLAIPANQYDIVCNGYEIASGAIRNHKPEIMRKAFAIAGYGDNVLEAQFGGMLRALQFGAPPHGGMAAGLDRIVMLLCGVKNLREITMFPMNQQARGSADGRALGGDAEAAPRAAHPSDGEGMNSRGGAVAPLCHWAGVCVLKVRCRRSGSPIGFPAAPTRSAMLMGLGGVTSALIVCPPARKAWTGSLSSFAISAGTAAEIRNGSAARICSR